MARYPQIVAPCLARIRAVAIDPATARAVELIAAHKLQEAADLLGAALGGPAARAESCLGLALVAYLAGDLDLGSRLARDAAEHGAGAAALALAGVCELSGGDFAAAAGTLRAALRAERGLHVAHALLWTALAGAGRLEEALAAVRTRLPAVAPASRIAAAPVEIENTTLCVVDCAHHALAARALALSMDGCRFEQVKFISDRPVAMPGVQAVRIAPIRSARDYSRFMVKELLAHVDTEHVLVIQWDGYVVSPGAWSPEFLLYDYVGARWNDRHEGVPARYDVGNGGFSLRSRALLEALQDPDIVELHPEDGAICRRYRALLEERHGIVFAPADAAERFSFEHIEPTAATFGFHGPTNLVRFVAADDWPALDFLFEAPGANGSGEAS